MAEQIEPGAQVETKVEPAVEVKQEPAAEVKVESGGARAEGSETAVVKIEPEVKVEPEPKPVDWRDKRIAQLTAKLREAQPLKTAESAPGAGALPAAGTPEFDQAVAQRAAGLAAQASFNQACEDVAKAGRTAFTDFDERISNFSNIVDQANPTEANAYAQLVATAIETGEGAKILHELGGDLNRAQTLLGLSPTKLAMELTRMAVGATPRREISQAAKPITPIGKTLSSDAEIRPDDPGRADKLSTKTWMERRNAQAAEVWARDNPHKRRA